MPSLGRETTPSAIKSPRKKFQKKSKKLKKGGVKKNGSHNRGTPAYKELLIKKRNH